MIISHKHKYIFLKTQKTAGTSVEIALSKYCGPDDIITPISPEDEEIRQDYGFRGPQNCFVHYSRYTLKDWYERIVKNKKAGFYNHISASEVRRWVGRKVWNSYFKFCIERNPWDKAISRYYWDLASFEDKKLSFEEFLRQKDIISHLTNYSTYTIADKLVVDKVCSYENLPQEMEWVAKKIGLPETPVLPHAKGGVRKDKRPYQEVIGEKERIQIQTICQKEIDLLGYTF